MIENIILSFFNKRYLKDRSNFKYPTIINENNNHNNDKTKSKKAVIIATAALASSSIVSIISSISIIYATSEPSLDDNGPSGIREPHIPQETPGTIIPPPQQQ
jgi:hypothetical protein